MIGIDTDVLGIHHIFKQDGRYPATERFLRESERIERGVPIFSLLELCGLIATARQPDEAMLIFEEYLASDYTSILYPQIEIASPQRFWARQNAELLERIERRVRLGDAAILWTIECAACEAFVTWNTKHYKGKTTITTQTPEEWLQSRGYH